MTTDADFEARVQRMVSEAVESAGAPDRRRLALLEQRLTAAAPSGRPWRRVVAGAGLVAVAAAAAAYWGWQQPDSRSGGDPAPDVIEGSIGSSDDRDNRHEDAAEPDKHGQSDGNAGDERIIYIGQ